MMRRLVRALALVLAFGASLPATAQDAPPALAPQDAAMRKALLLALRQIHRVPCDGATPCARFTPDEVDQPLIPLAEVRRIIDAGTLAGPAKWCGLAWQQQLFAPMMQHYSASARWTPRQLAVASLLFGIYQGQAEGPLLAAGPCGEDVAGQVAARIGALPAW